ncbi:glycosyltransferase family 2 protein [Flavobacterium frigidarium]|uniref:Glycosyltransferase family 2 protein n=1 Tax=Flavobacterium frigidarium TaxID=99286 RepID=A0ABV4KC24_9FLAO
MKVSVIVPFYSNIKWLEEAIESVLNQTFDDYEIIVVNDGSPEDDTIFVEKYKDKIVYYKTSNKGPAHARNFGMSVSRGDYIAFLDSDDLWLEEKLEKQVELMDRDNLMWSHTKYSVFDEVEDLSKRIYSEIQNENFKGNVFPRCLTHLNIGTPCVMLRSSYILANKHIRFSEKMRFGQDGYLWILIGLDNELGYINENLTYVRRIGFNAVQRARVHLNVRGNLNEYLIKNIRSLNPNVEIGFTIKLTYSYCSMMNKLINNLFGNKNYKKKSAELISKIVYLPAYVIFKNLIK